jgi:arsenate reductase
MAEGLLRAMGNAAFDAFSAGTEATHVRPLAVRAMAEIGIDISQHVSKTYEQYRGQQFDKVITVCDQADANCPAFFGRYERWHWSFPDPSQARGTEDEQLMIYRQVRDAIRDRIVRELIASTSASAPTST